MVSLEAVALRPGADAARLLQRSEARKLPCSEAHVWSAYAERASLQGLSNERTA